MLFLDRGLKWISWLDRDFFVIRCLSSTKQGQLQFIVTYLIIPSYKDLILSVFINGSKEYLVERKHGTHFNILLWRRAYRLLLVDFLRCHTTIVSLALTYFILLWGRADRLFSGLLGKPNDGCQVLFHHWQDSPNSKLHDITVKKNVILLQKKKLYNYVGFFLIFSLYCGVK